MYAIVDLIPGPFKSRIRPGEFIWRMPGVGSTECNSIILAGNRNDGFKALAWYRDNIVSDKITKIADSSDEKLAITTRDALESLTKDRQYVNPDQTWQAAVVDLLKVPFDKSFTPLTPLLSGYIEIWLGPRGTPFYFEKVAKARHNSKVYVDSFDRANGNLNGSTSSDGLFTWTEVDGTAWTIASNAASSPNIPDGVAETAVTSAACDSDDVYAFFTGTTFTRASGTFLLRAPVARVNSTGTNGYSAIAGVGADNVAFRSLFGKAQDAELDSDTGTNSTNQATRVECEGTTIRGIFNAVTVFSITNSGESSGATFRLASMDAYNEGNSTNDIVVNDFGYGDIVASVTRGIPFEGDGTAFNGGRALIGIIR